MLKEVVARTSATGPLTDGPTGARNPDNDESHAWRKPLDCLGLLSYLERGLLFTNYDKCWAFIFQRAQKRP